MCVLHVLFGENTELGRTRRLKTTRSTKGTVYTYLLQSLVVYKAGRILWHLQLPLLYLLAELPVESQHVGVIHWEREGQRLTRGRE